MVLALARSVDSLLLGDAVRLRNSACDNAWLMMLASLKEFARGVSERGRV